VNRRYYSKRHFERLSNGAPDTADQVRERLAYRAAAEKAHEEMLERFAPLSPDNALEAIEWQTDRIKELLNNGYMG